MRRRSIATEGAWWRCSSYEVADGYLLPERGATLERYSPWGEIEGAKEGDRQRAPYRELVDIAESRDREGRTGPETLERICAWCSRFGLLGVLLARARQVWLPAQPAASGSWEQQVFTRTASGWARTTRTYFGDALPAPPGVYQERAGRSSFETLEAAWRPFFPRPSAPAWSGDGDDPMPLSGGFWRQYGERVADFLDVASRFRNALRGAAALREDPRRGERGLGELTRWAATVSPTLRDAKAHGGDDGGDDDTLAVFWTSTTLLGSLAMMAMEDLSGRPLPIHCRGCSRVFLPTRRSVEYCSPECRSAEQKRRLRGRVRRARVLKSRGRTARQIARALGAELEVVEGWIEKPLRPRGRPRKSK